MIGGGGGARPPHHGAVFGFGDGGARPPRHHVIGDGDARPHHDFIGGGGGARPHHHGDRVAEEPGGGHAWFVHEHVGVDVGRPRPAAVGLELLVDVLQRPLKTHRVQVHHLIVLHELHRRRRHQF